MAKKLDQDNFALGVMLGSVIIGFLFGWFGMFYSMQDRIDQFNSTHISILNSSVIPMQECHNETYNFTIMASILYNEFVDDGGKDFDEFLKYIDVHRYIQETIAHYKNIDGTNYSVCTPLPPKECVENITVYASCPKGTFRDMQNDSYCCKHYNEDLEVCSIVGTVDVCTKWKYNFEVKS